MADIIMREIEVFLAVAKNQNISRTAEELFIAQSAVSSWIARMEEYCGVKLFRRTNRGVVLTPEGEMLYAELDIAYKRFRVSVEEICGRYTDSMDTLRVGSLNRLAVWDTAKDMLNRLSEAFPERKVKAERFNFHELRDKLLCGQLDLIFTISSDIAPYAEFDMLPLGRFPSYYLVRKGTEKISDLNGQTLIIEAPTNRSWAEQICSASGIVPGMVRYVNSYILMTTLAAAGEGFAIDGKIVTDNIYSPSTVLIPAETPENVQVVAAWKKERVPENVRESIALIGSMDREKEK